MEKPKVKKKRKKSREQKLWNRILREDFKISQIQLFQETLSANMTTMALELEKKRNCGKDYTR